MINCQEAEIALSSAPNCEGNNFGCGPYRIPTSLSLSLLSRDLIRTAAGPDFRPDAYLEAR
jgi:hypothetical protein